jgi:hypothetical protein
VSNIFAIDWWVVSVIALLVFILVAGFVMDAYAVLLKIGQFSGVGEMLAMSNLVQYMARMSNVLVIFILSILFETKFLDVSITLVFLCASFLGAISVFVLTKSESFCALIRIVLMPFLYPSFKKLAKQNIWKELNFSNKKLNRLTFFSTFTNSLIVLAMFAPFGIAYAYPEIRMTSVYVGQLINFLATILVFSIQDPISMRLIDLEKYDDVGISLVFGRVFSYVITVVIFLIIHLGF